MLLVFQKLINKFYMLKWLICLIFYTFLEYYCELNILEMISLIFWNAGISGFIKFNLRKSPWFFYNAGDSEALNQSISLKQLFCKTFWKCIQNGILAQQAISKIFVEQLFQRIGGLNISSAFFFHNFLLLFNLLCV